MDKIKLRVIAIIVIKILSALIGRRRKAESSLPASDWLAVPYKSLPISGNPESHPQESPPSGGTSKTIEP